MYTLIIIFYIALTGIIAMILLKRNEIITGKPSFVSNLGKGSDEFFHKLWIAIRKGMSYFNRRTFILIAQWITYHVLFNIRKVYVEIKHHFISNPHGKKMIDAVRGKGEIKNHGASFYLRRISSK